MFRSRAALPVIAAALGATAITACGSGSPHTATGTNNSSSRPTQAQIQRFQNDAVKFSDCMRNHGIADFPDAPGPNGAGGHTWKDAFQNTSPGFVAAETACRRFLPGRGHAQSSRPSHREIGAMLVFARCIRGHGIAHFPDPVSSTGITREQLAQAGIDLHQPAVAHAAYACVGVTHGVITRAMVARFIAGH